MDEILNFYIYQRGWLVFLLLPALIFVVMLVDNSRNARGGIGWVAATFLCLLMFFPAALYDLGPQETRQSLESSREIILYVGLLGLIVPLMLLVGYWLSNRPANTQQMGIYESQDETMLGAPNFGQPPIGAPQFGQPPIGAPQFGQPPIGAPQFGQPPIGAPQFGQPPIGAPNFGQPPIGAPMGGGSDMTTQINQGAPAISSANLVAAWLEDLSTSTRYQLRQGKNAIGRGNYEINLLHPTVSRQGHALVFVDDGTVILKDGGAESGILLNGVQVTKTLNMNHGDVLTVGEIKLRLIWGGV